MRASDGEFRSLSGARGSVLGAGRHWPDALLLAPSSQLLTPYQAAVFARFLCARLGVVARVLAARGLLPPLCARLRRRRSMRSTTSACCGSVVGSRCTFLPLILP